MVLAPTRIILEQWQHELEGMGVRCLVLGAEQEEEEEEGERSRAGRDERDVARRVASEVQARCARRQRLRDRPPQVVLATFAFVSQTRGEGSDSHDESRWERQWVRSRRWRALVVDECHKLPTDRHVEVLRPGSPLRSSRTSLGLTGSMVREERRHPAAGKADRAGAVRDRRRRGAGAARAGPCVPDGRDGVATTGGREGREEKRRRRRGRGRGRGGRGRGGRGGVGGREGARRRRRKGVRTRIAQARTAQAAHVPSSLTTTPTTRPSCSSTSSPRWSTRTPPSSAARWRAPAFRCTGRCTAGWTPTSAARS